MVNFTIRKKKKKDRVDSINSNLLHSKALLMFALYDEEHSNLGVLSLKMFLSIFICGMKAICNNIVPSGFVYMSRAELVKIVFHLPGAPLFSSFGIVVFSKGYFQVFKSARSSVTINGIVIFYDFCLSCQFFLLAINESCMPPKEKIQMTTAMS